MDWSGVDLVRRMPELRDLSEDHHHGLVLARNAKRAAVGEGDLSIDEVWDDIETKFETELEPHFQIEETFIGSVLETRDASQFARRLYAEHIALREFLVPGHSRTTTELRNFGELLEQHIRFEEREFFEIAQELLTPDELRAVASACHK